MELRLKKINTKNKKGFTDFTSLFFALAFLFATAIFFIVLSYSYGQIEPKLNSALANSTTPEKNSNVTEILGQTNTSLTRFNPLFPLLIVGVFGFVLVMALMGQSHPAFLFIGLIVLGIALILAAVYSNVYDELTTNTDLSDTGSDFGIMGTFIGNLPLVILILFVGIGIVLYMKSGGSQGI